MIRNFIVIFTAVLLLGLVSFPAVNSTSISLTDNAYSKIVVAISPDVPNTYAEIIVKNIQTMIRKASSVLYRATKQRAYFKDIRILIPDSWTNIRANDSTWETYSLADVKVAPASSAHGDAPYTVQSGGCGQPGEYIHITPDFLRTIGDPENTAAYGPAEKVFVHEWSHLRYGVFDERGQQGSVNYPAFFKPLPGSGKIVPNLCTDKPPIFTTKDVSTQGPCRINPTTGVYDDNCVYNLDQKFKPASSFMAQYSIDSIVDFCEDGQQGVTHVYNAPTKHNAMCGTLAAWTVISRHLDFDDNNPPRKMDDLNPEIQIVKSSGSRYVFVMDTSESMEAYNRITKLYDSSRRWIKYDIPDGSKLGLVEFNSNAVILSPLVLINNEESRQSLINHLPTKTNGETCIACGLLKALEVLEPGGQGGIIFLVTDGGENLSPFINDVINDVITASATVVSIALGGDAEGQIEDLSQQTNGKSYFIDDNDYSHGLNDAFIGSLSYHPTLPSDQITVLLFQRQYQKVTNETISDNFSVDYTVGRNLVFRIDYTQKSYLRSFSLQSPNGNFYTQLEYDEVAKVAMFKLPLAEVGKWYVIMTVSSSMVDSLAVHVSSLPRSNTTTPITTECYVPNGNIIEDAKTNPIRILAKVMQGANPVIQARVKAYVIFPSGETEILELLDSGTSADTTADDGIYSRYFTNATSQGRYSVKCEVWDDGSACIADGITTLASTLIARQTTPTIIGTLNRMAGSGSFKIFQPVSNVKDYPPSRIVDLIVTNMKMGTNKSITIQFTAPGDDLDSGTAFSYEIRYSTVFDDLRPNNFNSTGKSTLVLKKRIISGSLQPLPSGSKQTISFLVDVNKSCFVALRAKDQAGRYGEVSNIVSTPFPDSILDSGILNNTGLTIIATVFTAVSSLLAHLLPLFSFGVYYLS